MKKLYISVIFAGLIFLAFLTKSVAQDGKLPLKRTCGTVEYSKAREAADPSLREQREQLEKFTQNWIAKNKDNSQKSLYRVPVVVHIIYKTAAENIPDQRVFDQIDVLNRDFAGLNPHSMGSFSASLKINTDVEFCLAQQKPDGTPTNGIERKLTTKNSFSQAGDSMKFASKGGADSWDATRYFNIWVCNLGGGLLGYALSPPGTSNTHGVVILYTAFGVTPTGTPPNPYNLGATASHEIGHSLNLMHVWGDDAGACTGSDQCADTPNQADATYGAPTGLQTDTCALTSPGYMYMNFLDYCDDTTLANFTPDQKSRIQASLAGPLLTLAQSTACGPPPVAPVAGFTASAYTIVQYNSVTFTDTSTNSPTSWIWSCPGSSQPSVNGQGPVTVTYSLPGIYNVTLIVSNSAGSDTVVKQITVTPESYLLPDANFYADQTTILEGGTTNFFDLSANYPTSWIWKFQGGTPSTSTIQNPTGIQYNTAGDYKVTLTAVNYNGSDSLVKTAYIHVISTYGTQRPAVAFTASQRLITTGTTVYFTDQSTNNPASWSWTFYNTSGGVFSTSNFQNPQGVVYSNPGYYNVKLKVSNPNGSDSLTKTEYIVVTQDLMANVCDTISNLQLHEHIYYRKLTSTSGYLPGPNGDGIKAYADKFTDYTFSEISALVVGLKISKSASQDSYVRFKIWQGTTLPLDNNQVKFKDIKLNSMNPNIVKLVEFDSPVQVNGTFFVGYEVQYVQGDTFVVAMAVDRGNAGINTTYVKKANGAWSSIHDVYNINTSLFIEPAVCLVGINEIIEDEKLLIYPNPSHDKFNIQVEDDQWQDVEIRVFDMIGKMVESKADLISPHQYQIDMSNHKAGIYFLNIVKGNKSITKKISVIL